jgi:hypothetical protein
MLSCASEISGTYLQGEFGKVWRCGLDKSLGYYKQRLLGESGESPKD